MTSLSTSDVVSNIETNDSLDVDIEIEDGLSSCSSSSGRKGFVKSFFTSKGGPQILLLGILLSLGIGCIVGVVPDVTSDRYARLSHGYDGRHCSQFDRHDKPPACQSGADSAQNAAAIAALVMNVLTLVTNSVVGSISDIRGRRGFIISSMFLSTLSPLMLVLLQLVDSMHPAWFYIFDSSVGLINWTSMCFAALSDIMPPHFRGPSNGLLMSFFMLGFAIAPTIPVLLGHFGASLLAETLLLGGFFCALFALPETLPEEVSMRNLHKKEVERNSEMKTHIMSALWTLSRPMREISILNRSLMIRLLSVGAFFSGMVFSGDRTLVVYYIEDQLNCRDGDIALMFLVMGMCGFVIQGFVLKILVGYFGEKNVVVAAFSSGTFHNFLYGIASSKATIYLAFCFSQVTAMSFPLLSSIASNIVDAGEQGRVQGALFSLTALADAIGPLCFQAIYGATKDRDYPGPGSMFLFASILYAAGTMVVSALKDDEVDFLKKRRGLLCENVDGEASGSEPLLGDTPPRTSVSSG